jgi:hypothetical protein
VSKNGKLILGAKMTDTPTPTPTETPSGTPEATSEATPTVDYSIIVTADDGLPARVVREASTADIYIVLLLIAILASMWLMWIVNRLTERG